MDHVFILSFLGEEDDAQTASNMASKNPSSPANIYSSMNNHPRPNPNSIQNPIMQRPTGGRYPPGRRPTNFNEPILPTSRSQVCVCLYFVFVFLVRIFFS